MKKNNINNCFVRYVIQRPDKIFDFNVEIWKWRRMKNRNQDSEPNKLPRVL